MWPVLPLLFVASLGAGPAGVLTPGSPTPAPLVSWSGSPPARPDQAGTQAGTQSGAYEFPSGAGLLFFYVRPEHAAEFEGVMARLDAALSAATDPVRARQAVNWRIYRSLESHEERIYVFLFDPAVPGTSYDPVQALSDLLPGEVQQLYARLKAAIIRVERMGLARLR